MKARLERSWFYWNQNFHVNKTNFLTKGFTLGLALKHRRQVTRKRAIALSKDSKFQTENMVRITTALIWLVSSFKSAQLRRSDSLVRAIIMLPSLPPNNTLSKWSDICFFMPRMRWKILLERFQLCPIHFWRLELSLWFHASRTRRYIY